MSIIQKYYDSGFLKAKGLMKDNLKHGKWMFYFESGELQMEIEYKNDKEHGVFKRWFINGKLAIESYYEEGESNGYWKEYYENGHTKQVGEYKNGQYFPIDFWDEEGIQLLKDGTGKTIEKFGYLELDIVEQYFENGKFIKEVKVSSAQYGGFEPTSNK